MSERSLVAFAVANVNPEIISAATDDDIFTDRLAARGLGVVIATKGTFRSGEAVVSGANELPNIERDGIDLSVIKAVRLHAISPSSEYEALLAGYDLLNPKGVREFATSADMARILSRWSVAEGTHPKDIRRPEGVEALNGADQEKLNANPNAEIRLYVVNNGATFTAMPVAKVGKSFVDIELPAETRAKMFDISARISQVVANSTDEFCFVGALSFVETDQGLHIAQANFRAPARPKTLDAPRAAEAVGEAEADTLEYMAYNNE